MNRLFNGFLLICVWLPFANGYTSRLQSLSGHSGTRRHGAGFWTSMQISAFLGSEPLRDDSTARFSLSCCSRLAFSSVAVLLGSLLGFCYRLHCDIQQKKSAIVLCILSSRRNIRNSRVCGCFILILHFGLQCKNISGDMKWKKKKKKVDELRRAEP